MSDDLAERINYSALDDRKLSRDDFADAQLNSVGLTEMQTDYFSNRKYRLLKFALDNGWTTYLASGQISDLDDVVYFRGIYGEIRYWLQDSNKLILIADWRGGDDSKYIACGFARIILPRRVPHIIIYNYDITKCLKETRIDGKKLNLEGEFSKFFTVVVPPRYERDALQLLTPDVMQTFLDYGKDFNFEIIGNKLYVFAKSKSIESSWGMYTLLRAATKVYNDLAHQAKKYSDDKYQKSYRDDGSLIREISDVSDSGKQLKVKERWWIYLLWAVISAGLILMGIFQ